MPPAIIPIPVAILDNLETALQGINGGSSYWHTVLYVKLGEPISEAPGTPFVSIGELGSIGRYSESREGDVTWHKTLHWSIPIIGALDGKYDAPRRLLKLAADIYKAVMADYSRGGNAIKTTWEGFEPRDVAVSDEDVRSGLVCWIDVHFRTRDTDMSLQ